MSDIVSRLRSGPCSGDPVFEEAADEIERLRKALEPFAEEAACYDPDTGDSDDTVWATPAYFKIRDLRRARTALDAVKER